MVEKRFPVENLTISYNGPIDIVDFFKTVEDWITKKGMNKEIKKKSEEVSGSSRRVEWMIEMWEMPGDYAKPIVRMQSLIKDIKDVSVKIHGKKKNVQVGDVLIVIDGILETDIEGRWYQKPTFYFLRAVYDKYFSKFYTHRFEAKLTKDTYEFYNYLMGYFNSYKAKDEKKEANLA